MSLKRTNPYVAYRFGIEIGGLLVGAFSEVKGLGVETELEEYREGGVNNKIHYLPKGIKYSRITFKRGITNSTVLWDWYRDCIQGTVVRRNGAVILNDADGNALKTWSFVEAYPVKWVGPELNALKSEAALESFEIVIGELTCE